MCVLVSMYGCAWACLSLYNDNSFHPKQGDNIVQTQRVIGSGIKLEVVSEEEGKKMACDIEFHFFFTIVCARNERIRKILPNKETIIVKSTVPSCYLYNKMITLTC